MRERCFHYDRSRAYTFGAEQARSADADAGAGVRLYSYCVYVCITCINKPLDAEIPTYYTN